MRYTEFMQSGTWQLRIRREQFGPNFLFWVCLRGTVFLLVSLHKQPKQVPSKNDPRLFTADFGTTWDEL